MVFLLLLFLRNFGDATIWFLSSLTTLEPRDHLRRKIPKRCVGIVCCQCLHPQYLPQFLQRNLRLPGKELFPPKKKETHLQKCTKKEFSLVPLPKNVMYLGFSCFLQPCIEKNPAISPPFRPAPYQYPSPSEASKASLSQLMEKFVKCISRISRFSSSGAS